MVAISDQGQDFLSTLWWHAHGLPCQEVQAWREKSPEEQRGVGAWLTYLIPGTSQDLGLEPA